jgi:hypothetical protein
MAKTFLFSRWGGDVVMYRLPRKRERKVGWGPLFSDSNFFQPFSVLNEKIPSLTNEPPKKPKEVI